jgi:RNA polymerase sigma-70 factor, ECF subfamily
MHRTLPLEALLGQSMTGGEEVSRATGAEVFEELYDTHFDFVWRTLRRFGTPPELLDDAVQDVFLVVHRKLATLESQASIHAWLYGIARRVASDHNRSRKRRERIFQARGSDHDSVADTAVRGPEQSVEDLEAARVLERLLSAIPPERREVFVLAELEELTAPAISDLLGLEVTTVHSRLRAARSDFRQALARLQARTEGRKQ